MAEQKKQDLSRRAVACKHWRWMRGMRSVSGWMVYDDHRGLDVVNIAGGDIDFEGGELRFDDPETLSLPDLDDPATLGCLLALVREAWGESFNNYSWNDRGLAVTVTASGAGNVPEILEGVSQFYGEPAEALVAALEAAP